MLLKLSLVVIALTTAACIKVRDPKKESNDSQNAPAVSEITYEIEALDQPNRYLVKFTGLGPDSLVQRSGMGQKGKVEVQSITGSEDMVEQGGFYEYQFQVQGQMRKIQVQVPTDVVVEGIRNVSEFELEEIKSKTQRINKRLKVEGRLYFKERSALITGGQNVLIEADWIHSEGATLQTFLDSNLLVSDKEPASGGTIYLKSRGIRGTLRVEMKGQTGQVGSVLNARTDGYSGGNSGELFIEIENLEKGRVEPILQPGEGIKGRAIKTCHPQPNNPCVKKTIKPAGADGQPGVAQPVCFLKNMKCEYKDY